MENLVPRIVGGIGDALLMLDGALAVGEVVVHSHCKGLPALIGEFGVTVREFVPYSTPRAIPTYDGPTLEHVTWPMWTLPEHIDPRWARITHGLERPTVAIQPFGSPYSKVGHSGQGRQTKTILDAPLNHAVEALNNQYDVLIVCSPDEAAQLTIEPPHVILDGSLLANMEAIWDCDAFIGIDSCGKTMAAIHEIPTFVLMGDFPDGLRDKVFVKPYVDAGVMQTQRFWRMKNRHTRFALEYLLEDCTNL